MNNNRLTSKEMVAKSKNKALSCSTPEHRIGLESPSRDSDSICDSDSASPVPFLCTQDGAEGETDVVWNFYTPKSETAKSRFKNTTPVSRRTKKTRPIPIEKPLPRRRAVKPSQKKSELFQELMELNQNLHEYISKKPSITTVVRKPQSEDDIFSDTSDSSPRSGVKTKTRCLRKNVLSSKFTKTEPESGLESDDSMNECLLKASQVVEENILNLPKPAKRPCVQQVAKSLKPGLPVNIDQNSMDAILSNIKLESPTVQRIKKCDSPRLNNDSFDCILSNLNDSALERLTQNMPLKDESRNLSNKTSENSWMLKELVVCDGSPSSTSIFGRHNSMPESPSVNNSNKPSTSGMAFGRYSSMPFNKSDEKITGDSPIRCTPDEIKKKHKQAREKLLAKRMLPFTSTQQSIPALLQPQVQPIPKKTSFQLKVPSSKLNNIVERTEPAQKSNADVNIKLIIEKKRQEALMKLRKRQPQNK